LVCLCHPQEAIMAKTKIPKTIAGVKVPKALRKSGAVSTMLNNPLGREILAGAIVAGATAAAAALVKHRPSAGQVADAGEGVVDAGGATAGIASDAVQDAASTLAGVVASAAKMILPDALTGTDRKRKHKPKANRAGKDKRAGGKARRSADRELRMSY
jgi:hypothetical protein